MTKTTNYQLNQWERTDRIMMDDFNADNQKLEAALTNALLGKRAIKTYTVTTTQPGYIDIPIDDIDFSQWSIVGMEVPFRPQANDSTVLACYANIGQDTFSTNGHSGLLAGTANPFVLLYLPMHDPERTVSAIGVIPGGGYGCAPNLKFKDLNLVRILYNSAAKQLPLGLKIHFWGIR